MSNYLKGFFVSSALHLAALGLILAVSSGGLFAEREIRLVDFSSVSVGPPQEGGDIKGDGEAPPAGEPEETAVETPAPPPPVAEPEPAPLPPVQAKPKPELSKKNVPAPQRTAPQPQTWPAAPAPAVNPSPGAGSGGSPEGRGTGPGAGSGREQGLAQSYVNANYKYILLHISRNFEYPSQARRMGLNGTATFSFTIQKDGNIKDLRLDKGSGHRILDDAVEKAITRAAPFPPPPVPARIVIPIRCRLT